MNKVGVDIQLLINDLQSKIDKYTALKIRVVGFGNNHSINIDGCEFGAIDADWYLYGKLTAYTQMMIELKELFL